MISLSKENHVGHNFGCNGHQDAGKFLMILVVDTVLEDWENCEIVLAAQ
jgi:hypothetical protein